VNARLKLSRDWTEHSFGTMAFYVHWAHEPQGLLSPPCGCIRLRLLVAQLERDAIFDASSLPDPSSLQSENVQEGWNWTANSYQKR
jgi:hypothetical protein